jgi:hypothetical protein
VYGDIVTERLERLARKRVVDAFGLLQADDVRLALSQPGHRRVKALLDRIDIPGGNTHGRLRVQSAKLVPQPQDAVAFGLLTLNEDPMRSSTKSISEPTM